MKIRIEPNKIEDILNFINMVKDHNEDKDPSDKMSLILDSEQGHFIHVLKKKKCAKCGCIHDPKKIQCPECGVLALGRSNVIYVPLGVSR